MFCRCLPGVKAFEVNSCCGNDLLPQLQVFTERLNHWEGHKWQKITIEYYYSYYYYFEFLGRVILLVVFGSPQNRVPLEKKICSFQYSSSVRNFKSFWRSFIRSCLSSTHCKLWKVRTNVASSMFTRLFWYTSYSS